MSSYFVSCQTMRTCSKTQSQGQEGIGSKITISCHILKFSKLQGFPSIRLAGHRFTKVKGQRQICIFNRILSTNVCS